MFVGKHCSLRKIHKRNVSNVGLVIGASFQVFWKKDRDVNLVLHMAHWNLFKQFDNLLKSELGY